MLLPAQLPTFSHNESLTYALDYGLQSENHGLQFYTLGQRSIESETTCLRDDYIDIIAQSLAITQKFRLIDSR